MNRIMGGLLKILVSVSLSQSILAANASGAQLPSLEEWKKNTEKLLSLQSEISKTNEEKIANERKTKIAEALSVFHEVYLATVNGTESTNKLKLEEKQKHAIQLLSKIPIPELIKIKAELDLASRMFSTQSGMEATKLLARIKEVQDKKMEDPNPIFINDITLSLEAQLSGLQKLISERNSCPIDKLQKRIADIEPILNDIKLWQNQINTELEIYNKLTEKAAEEFTDRNENEEWISRIENIFEFSQINKPEVVLTSSNSLSNETINYYDKAQNAGKCLLGILTNNDLLTLIHKALEKSAPELQKSIDYNNPRLAYYFSKIGSFYQNPKKTNQLTAEGIKFLNILFNFEANCKARISSLSNDKSPGMLLNELILLQADIKKHSFNKTIKEQSEKRAQLLRLLGIEALDSSENTYSNLFDKINEVTSQQNELYKKYNLLNDGLKKLCEFETEIQNISSETLNEKSAGASDIYTEVLDNLNSIESQIRAFFSHFLK